MLEIRPAAPEDVGAIKVLLAVCLLPSQDISCGQGDFFVAETERGIIGVCGIESCSDKIALLRSLGVMPGYRKQQIGRRLVQRCTSHAENQGFSRLYLLTESATSYFLSAGFATEERKLAPEALKASQLFTLLCPTHAALMIKRLSEQETIFDAPPSTGIEAVALQHLRSGYNCAESVLLAVADHADLSSPLIPRMATGFCNDARCANGECGALAGAILAVNLALGRNTPHQSSSITEQAVQQLMTEFEQHRAKPAYPAYNKECGDAARLPCFPPAKGKQCRDLVSHASRLAGQVIAARMAQQTNADLCGAAA